MVPHATRTALRRLLLRKGVEVPPVRELTLRVNPHFRHYTPTFRMRWRDVKGKRHQVIYYFCAGQPYLEADNKPIPLTLEEVQLYGLYKAKE